MRKRYIDTRYWIDSNTRSCTWLEKRIWEYFQICPEMTTIGAATTNLEKVEIMINGESRKNPVTPDFPWIERKHILAAIKWLKKRRLIEIQNTCGITIYDYKFLKYNPWGPSVYRGFPDLVRDQIPEGPMQDVVRDTSVKWMGENRVEIPEPWR